MKPLYRVPSMTEIAALPWNGYRVASTFSGCGGSCLGYRMAGFRVVWANEFVPAAQASYKANAAEDCVLDCRDIRHVQPEDILKAIGCQVGELDLFDGSPPCQAFSTAGKREKGWGQDRVYEHGAKQKNETLFDEYIRLLRGLQPKMFVAENVSGLVKGTAKGYFLDILAGLKASGYRVAAKVLDAQWLGVPQQRQRVIFIGVRNDLGLEPAHPRPLPYRYSVADALPWLRRVVQDPNGQYPIQDQDAAQPCFAITTSNAHHVMVEGANGFNGHAGTTIDQPMPTVQAGRPVSLETDISRFAIGKEWDTLAQGEQSSRYFSLIRASSDKPCPAKMAGHGNASTAGVTHPTERRKFTIAELKRICAFPDDFVLIGSYAQQWERLGNSVPPLMAKAIGESVLSILRQVKS